MNQSEVIDHILSKPIPYFFSYRSSHEIQQWQAPLIESLKNKLDNVPFFQSHKSPYSAKEINRYGHEQFVHLISQEKMFEESLVKDNQYGDCLILNEGVSSTGRVFLYLNSQFSQFYANAFGAYLISKFSKLSDKYSRYSYISALHQGNNVSWFSDFGWIYNKQMYGYPYIAKGSTVETYIPLDKREELLEVSFSMANDISMRNGFSSLDNLGMFMDSLNKNCFLHAMPNQLDFLISIEIQMRRPWKSKLCNLVNLSGEMVHPPLATKIKEYFGNTPILNSVDHTAGGGKMWLCPQGGWHITPLCLAETNEKKELILTNLASHRILWYKYDTEDMVENLRWGSCSCGFTGQMCDKYIGKNMNSFIVNSRCFTSGSIQSIIHLMLAPQCGIDQCRVIQNEDESILIEVVPYESNDRLYRPLDLKKFQQCCSSFFQTEKIRVVSKQGLTALAGENKVNPIVCKLPESKLQGQIVNYKK